VEKGIFCPCPICDGYESIDRAIAITGHGIHAVREVMFLLTHTRDHTILSLDQAAEWSEACSAAGTQAPRRLIEMLGLDANDEGCVRVQEHCRTSVPGAVPGTAIDNDL